MMQQQRIGQFLVAAAFLCGAFLTSLDHSTLNWKIFIPVMLVGVIGLIIIRKAEKRANHSDGVLTTNLNNIEESLTRIVDNLIALNNRKDDLPAYEVRFEIDTLFRDDLTLFAESRHSLGHRYGLQPYADIMSAFAAGERYINRVWSASADGYIDEVKDYLTKAQAMFIEARDKLNEMTKKNR